MGTLKDSFKTPEIRKKILFTFLIVSVLCLLTIVPIPGLNHAAAVNEVAEWGNMFTVFNILSGHALENISIVSLGIYPFLVASIIIQIVVVAVPKLRNLSQMGDEGTKIVTKLTRIASIISAVVFAALYCVGMREAVSSNINFWVGIVLCGISVAVGSAFCGWSVELINNKGLGDGLTVIIVADIVRNIPEEMFGLYQSSISMGLLPAIALVVAGCIFTVGVLFFVLLVFLGEKKLRLLFSKRTVGMKQYGMQNQVLPLKVAQAGIMPVIYTMVILLLPSAIAAMTAHGSESLVAVGLKNFLTSVGFIPLFIILVVFFSYVFAMMQFNPLDLAEQLKDNGGYIQGLRPGKATSQYLISMYTNLGAAYTFFLNIICVVPMILNFIPALGGICLGGVGMVLVAGGFIEMKTLLDNALKAEEDKAKQAGKDKRRSKKYNK